MYIQTYNFVHLHWWHLWMERSRYQACNYVSNNRFCRLNKTVYLTTVFWYHPKMSHYLNDWPFVILALFKITPKSLIWILQFWYFPPIFVYLTLTCLVTLFDCKRQTFKNSPKWTIIGIFNELLSTQNLNVARFARNIEWDFFCDFQTQ